MSWQLTVTGSSDDPQTETEIVDFFRRVFSVFRDDNAPCEITNAQVVGSQTTTHNLLSNPEPTPEDTTKTASAPEPRQPWQPDVPAEPSAFASNLTAEEAANLPAPAVVHGSGPDTGQAPVIPESTTTTTSETTTSDVPPVTTTDTTSEGGV